MKKIIALALALIMALSMASVAFAYDYDYQPGEKIPVPGYNNFTAALKSNLKISYDFTSAYVVDSTGAKVKVDWKGASLIDDVKWEKDAADSKTLGVPVYDLVIVLKENLTGTTAKDLNGVVKIYDKTAKTTANSFISGKVGNDVEYIAGEKKADEATKLTTTEMAKNVVMLAEDGAGYVTFTDDYALTGLVKVEKDEKAQVYFDAIDADTQDAIDAYLGEDYEAIVEKYNFAGTGFKNDVAFTYAAYEEDPHFFYAWDGEKFVDLEGKYNDDEEVEAYEFTAPAKGIIIVTDVEIVAAEEETKNPDTGANDVVGVAAALAVVSLVAAGAVSLKK